MKTPFNEDDYFQNTSMSFGEHIEELRTVLIRALFGLFIAILLGFVAAPSVVKFFKEPLEEGLGAFYLDKATDEALKKFGGNAPAEVLNLIKDRQMVPEYQQVEPSEFVENLRRQYPGQFESLKFSASSYTPDDFQADELIVHWYGLLTERRATFVKFAARLAREGEAEADSIGKIVWTALSPEDRSFVSALAKKKETEVVSDERVKLAAIMQQQLDRRDTLTSETWSAPKTADDHKGEKIQDLRARLAGSEKTESTIEAMETLRRYNKQVLAFHFKGELRPPQLTLVDVPIWKPVKIRVQALNAQEAFMIWMKAAFMSGLVLASPWIFYQVWVFVAAGLYPHEKNYVYMYLPVSLGLFLAGASLAFFAVFKPVLQFLFWFNKEMEIDPDPRIGEWLGFVLLMPIAFGVSFQLPLVMLFLNRIGVVAIETYLEHWRIAVLIIAVVAMILTPSADPYSMLLMMIPLVVLYFLGVLMCRWMPKGRNPFTEVYEP